MPLLDRRFSERNPTILGAVGLALAGTLTVGALNLGTLVHVFSQTSYTAEFSESGNLAAGDEVRLSGVKVGQVNNVAIDGEHVAVRFSVVDEGRLGTDTRASVDAATVLGTRFLNLLPAGPGQMRAGDVIPLSRTDSPYDLSQILATLTTKSQALDKVQVERALGTLSTELSSSPSPLKAALTGVNRLSQTVGSRDLELRELLGHAAAFTKVLAARSGDIFSIVAQGNLLLSELDRRQTAMRQLQHNVEGLVSELRGLVADNQRDLGPALNKLNSVLEMLNHDNDAIAASIHGLNLYTGGLGEIANSAPLFMADVRNIAPPTNLIPGLPLGSRGPSIGPAPPGPSRSPAAPDLLPMFGDSAAKKGQVR